MFGSAYAIMLSRLANNGMNQGNKQSLSRCHLIKSELRKMDKTIGQTNHTLNYKIYNM